MKLKPQTLVLIMYGISLFIILSICVGCDINAGLPHHIDYLLDDGVGIYHDIENHSYRMLPQCEYMRDNIRNNYTRCHLT